MSDYFIMKVFLNRVTFLVNQIIKMFSIRRVHCKNHQGSFLVSSVGVLGSSIMWEDETLKNHDGSFEIAYKKSVIQCNKHQESNLYFFAILKNWVFWTLMVFAVDANLSIHTVIKFCCNNKVLILQMFDVTVLMIQSFDVTKFYCYKVLLLQTLSPLSLLSKRFKFINQTLELEIYSFQILPV